MGRRGEWAEWARAAGRCLATADDLRADRAVILTLPGGVGLSRVILQDETAWRDRAALLGRRARNLYALRVTS